MIIWINFPSSSYVSESQWIGRKWFICRLFCQIKRFIFGCVSQTGITLIPKTLSFHPKFLSKKILRIFTFFSCSLFAFVGRGANFICGFYKRKSFTFMIFLNKILFFFVLEFHHLLVIYMIPLVLAEFNYFDGESSISSFTFEVIWGCS